MRKIKTRTVGTDVVVIPVGAFRALSGIQHLADIWVAFGMRKSYRFLSINAICGSLGEPKTQALPGFLFSIHDLIWSCFLCIVYLYELLGFTLLVNILFYAYINCFCLRFR